MVVVEVDEVVEMAEHQGAGGEDMLEDLDEQLESASKSLASATISKEQCADLSLQPQQAAPPYTPIPPRVVTGSGMQSPRLPSICRCRFLPWLL